MRSESIQYGRLGGTTNAVAYIPEHSTSDLWVVFCHGTGNDHLYPQKDLFKELLKIGISIFTFDLDGHGKRSSTHLSAEEIQSCVSEAIAQCRKKFNAKKVLLIGHSLGAVMALGEESNELVCGTVAISLPVHLPLKRGTLLSEMRGLLKIHTIRQIFNYGFIGSLPSAGTFRRNALPIRLQDLSIVKKGFYYVPEIHKFIEQQNVPQILKSAKKPRLIVSGSCDMVAPAELIEEHLIKDGLTKYQNFPGENHVSLIFSPKCLKLISDFAKDLSNGLGSQKAKST